MHLIYIRDTEHGIAKCSTMQATHPLVSTDVQNPWFIPVLAPNPFPLQLLVLLTSAMAELLFSSLALCRKSAAAQVSILTFLKQETPRIRGPSAA